MLKTLLIFDDNNNFCTVQVYSRDFAIPLHALHFQSSVRAPKFPKYPFLKKKKKMAEVDWNLVKCHGNLISTWLSCFYLYFVDWL